jgi:hypothetical protein
VEPKIEREVRRNQSESADLWDDTDRDIAIANIAAEAERLRNSRRQIIAGLVVCIVLLLAALVYSNRTAEHDRLLAQERQAAAEKPYTPQTIVPSN